MRITANINKAEAEATINSTINIMESFPFNESVERPEMLPGNIDKFGNKSCSIIEKIDDAGNVNIDVAIDTAYFLDCLKVVEDLTSTFSPEIMSMLTKLSRVIKGDSSLVSMKLKAFKERAKKLISPYMNKDNVYAVIKIHDLEAIGVYAAAVIEDNGFTRRWVHTTCNGDRPTGKFVDSLVKKIDFYKMDQSEFVYTSRGWAIDEARSYVDEMVDKEAKTEVDEKTVIVNGVRGGMDINTNIDCIVE